MALAPADAGRAISPIDIALLQPDPARAHVYVAGGVDLVTLELGWDAYQPSPKSSNPSYVEKRVAEARAYSDAGLDVVLDLGIQYPPAWAWSLPGSTRFTNQYGEQWHGGIGTDAIDGVWNDAVRKAQAAYIEAVSRDFAGLADRVRVGGLLSGEIRLPPARHGERVDSLWAFSPGALRAAPDPTWRPGTGSVGQARAWLDFYLNSVSGYAVWLSSTVTTAFPSMPIDLLLPGWGVRPGDLSRVAHAQVSTASVVSMGDDLAGGLDWARQLRALARRGIDVTAVTTWLDAPSYGTAARDLAPVEYLSTLVRPLSIPLSGENTGGGGHPALNRTREQATRFDLVRVTWMSARTLDQPGEVRLAELSAAFPD